MYFSVPYEERDSIVYCIFPHHRSFTLVSTWSGGARGPQCVCMQNIIIKVYLSSCVFTLSASVQIWKTFGYCVTIMCGLIECTCERHTGLFVICCVYSSAFYSLMWMHLYASFSKCSGANSQNTTCLSLCGYAYTPKISITFFITN